MTRIDRWCNNITDAIVVLGLLCLLLGAMSCHVHYHVTIKTDGETPHQKPKNEMTYYKYPEITLQGTYILPDTSDSVQVMIPCPDGIMGCLVYHYKWVKRYGTNK